MIESPLLSPKFPNLLEKTNFDSVLTRLGVNRFTIRVFLFIGLFFMADGSEMIVLSLLVSKLSEIFELNSFEKGSLGSSIFIGFAAGSLFSGWVSDRKGRRTCYLFGSSLVMIFALLSSLAQGYYSFILLRIVCGFGIGMAIPALFALATEVTPKEYRSIVLNNVWSIFPIGAAFVILMAKFFIDLENGWRYILLFAALPCVILLFLSHNVPESPRFYLSNGEYEKGFAQIQKIVDFSLLNDKFELSERDKRDLIAEVEYIKLNKEESSYKLLFTPEYRRVTFLICCIFFIVSLNYYGAIFILPQIFEKENESEEKNVGDIYISLLFGCFLEVPSYFLAGYLGNHPHLLRIKTMILGFVLNGFAAFIVLIYPAGITLFSALFKCSVAISFSVIFVYACEAYPTKIRSMGVGLGHSCTRIAAILTPFISQYFFEISHLLPFIFYIIGAVAGVVCCIALPFETYDFILK